MSERYPLILLPGLMDDAGIWSHQVRHLADLAEPLVCAITGHETMAALAAEVLAGVEGPFALAGFSMGGFVALEIMRQAPERVRALALVDSSARPDVPARAAQRTEQIRLAQSGRFEDTLEEEFLRFVASDPALAASIRAVLMRQGPEVFVRQQRACMTRPDSRGDLARIACPTLVICGRQDEITTPEMAEELATGIPGARLAMIEDCAHYAPLERAQAVTALMRQWLLYP